MRIYRHQGCVSETIITQDGGVASNKNKTHLVFLPSSQGEAFEVEFEGDLEWLDFADAIVNSVRDGSTKREQLVAESNTVPSVRRRSLYRPELLDMEITSPMFSTRLRNVLAGNGVHTVRDLVNKTGPDLFRMGGFGSSMFGEVEEFFNANGLWYRQPQEDLV